MGGTIRQFSLDPGESKRLGRFKDGDQHDVTVTARVRTCDEDPGDVDINIASDAWEVVVPPDQVAQVDGLNDGEQAITLAIVAGGCAETDHATPDKHKDNWGVAAPAPAVVEFGIGVADAVDAPDD